MSIIAASVVVVLCLVQTSGVSAQPAGEPPPAASADPSNATPAAGAPAADEPSAEPAATPPAAPAEPAPETSVEAAPPAATPAAPPSGAPAATPGATPAAPGQPPAAPPAPGAADTDRFATVRQHLVVVKDGLDAAANSAPGFGVSGDGHVLTHARGLRDVPSYVVTTSGGQVFQATKVAQDEPTGLLLLKVVGSAHGLTPLPFARTALHPADPLHAVRFDPSGAAPFTTTPGTVTRLFAADEGWPAIAHNALFGPASAGTPLLNRCFQAVGVNVLERQGFFGREVDPTEQGSARSVAASHVGDFLRSAGLTLPVVAEECPSLEEETRQQLERAQQEKTAAEQEKEAAEARAAAQAEEAQREAEEASRKEAALQAEKDAAEQRAAREEAETAAQRQRAEEESRRAAEAAERLREEAQRKQEAETEARLAEERARLREEEARRAEERKRQTLQYATVGGGALALAVLALLLAVRAKRKRLAAAEREKADMAGDLDRAQSELSAASERDRLRTSAPDVFLDGADARGRPIALKIPGASLVEPAGAVVGRSPADATFVINHEQVSRRHFRLALVSQRVMVEDMGSTNGTSVDGARLAPGAAVPLADGSRLALGDLHLTVRTG